MWVRHILCIISWLLVKFHQDFLQSKIMFLIELIQSIFHENHKINCLLYGFSPVFEHSLIWSLLYSHLVQPCPHWSLHVCLCSDLVSVSMFTFCFVHQPHTSFCAGWHTNFTLYKNYVFICWPFYLSNVVWSLMRLNSLI